MPTPNPAAGKLPIERLPDAIRDKLPDFLTPDTSLDVFIANWNSADRVLFNDGKGTFTDSGQALGNYPSTGIALGDLDRDGDLDAITSGDSGRIYMNNGKGVFMDSGQALPFANDVALGDLDRDGDLDAFLSGSDGLVFLNTGNGTFVNSGQARPPNIASTGSALGDLDGDGDTDAYIANYASSNTDRVYLNNGNAMFTDSGQAVNSRDTHDVALADLDGDGDLDAFTVGFVDRRVQLNDGKGVFTLAQVLEGRDPSGIQPSPFGGPSLAVDLGDLDGDGDIDAFVATNYAERVYLNNGNGIFTVSGQALGSNTFDASQDVKLGDLDRDGDLDAYVANFYGPNYVYFNDGAGTFAGQALGGGGSMGVALGNFNGIG